LLVESFRIWTLAAGREMPKGTFGCAADCSGNPTRPRYRDETPSARPCRLCALPLVEQPARRTHIAAGAAETLAAAPQAGAAGLAGAGLAGMSAMGEDILFGPAHQVELRPRRQEAEAGVGLAHA